MKLLFLADAGSHTGFATVTHNIGERLVRDHGHEVYVLASNYRGDYVDTNLKLLVPTILSPQDIYGMARLVRVLGDVQPDAIVTVNDPAIVMRWLYDNPWDTEHVLLRGLQTKSGKVYRPPMLSYLPIDGYDCPRVWDAINLRAKRVAMTHFGQAAMPEAPVVWHGIDTSVFYPIPKKDAKRALGFDPDRFLILRTDKNSIRKDYPDTWRALRPLMRKYKDIDVAFHCLPRAGDGYDLRAFTSNDTDINKRLSFSQNLDGFLGWEEEGMRLLYSAADLYVSTSHGEGFGLTLLEAMACGTPVVAQDCSAITEVVGPGGVLVPAGRRYAVAMGQDQCLPDPTSFMEAVERLYLGGGSRRKLGQAAVAHASKFSWDYAATKFNEMLVEMVKVGVPSGPMPIELRTAV